MLFIAIHLLVESLAEFALVKQTQKTLFIRHMDFTFGMVHL